MSLVQLFSLYGVTASSVATRLQNAFGRVDPLLFERIDQGRQPLPLEMVLPIATIIGSSKAEVRVAASKLSTSTGRDSRVAHPPRLGDSFQSAQLLLATSVAVPAAQPLNDFQKMLGLGPLSYYRSTEDLSESSGATTGWLDQVSTHHFEQPTAGDRPAYVASHAPLNGFPAIHIDSTTKHLETVGNWLALTDFTVLYVEDAPTPSTNSNFALVATGGLALQMSTSGQGTGLPQKAGIYDSTAHRRVSVGKKGGPTMRAVVADATANEVAVWRDGAKFGTDSYDGAIDLSGIELIIGAIGGASQAGAYRAEYWIFDRPLTDYEIEEIWFVYASNRYALPLIDVKTKALIEMESITLIDFWDADDLTVTSAPDIDAMIGQLGEHDLTQAVTAQKPHEGTNGPSGTSSADCDGTDDGFDITGASVLSTNKSYTMAYGCNILGAPFGDREAIFDCSTGSGGRLICAVATTGLYEYGHWDPVNGYQSTGVPAVNGEQRLIWTFQNGGNCEIYKDGSLLGVPQAYAGQDIGNIAMINDASYGVPSFNGYVWRCLLADGVPSAADRVTIDEWLAR